MQVNINPGSSRPGVVSIGVQKRIKCRSWICIQKRFPQSRLADCTGRQVLPLVPGITETSFPVPPLEIIAKFTHLAAQPNIKYIIVVSELLVYRDSIIHA